MKTTIITISAALLIMLGACKKESITPNPTPNPISNPTPKKYYAIPFIGGAISSYTIYLNDTMTIKSEDTIQVKQGDRITYKANTKNNQQRTTIAASLDINGKRVMSSQNYAYELYLTYKIDYLPE